MRRSNENGVPNGEGDGSEEKPIDRATEAVESPDQEVYRFSYDAPSKRPSIAVVEAVSAATDANPTEIGPLYSTIDPEALDSLFRPNGGGEARAGGRVTFALDGHEVTVRSEGVVEVRTGGADW